MPMKSLIVSPNGLDTGDGSEQSPLATLNKALAAALPGDSVVVRGVVTGQTVAVKVSGTPEAPISIIQHADGGAIDGGFVWPKLPKGDHLTAPDGTISHFGALVNITANDVQWSVDVRNSLGRAIGVTGDNVTLQDCVIDWCRNGCINIQDCKGIRILRVKYSHGGSYYQSQRQSTKSTSWPVCCYLLRVTGGLVQGCEGFENWGEGLAAGRGCTAIHFIKNKLWDNLSANLYLDRANHSIVSGNRIYCTGKTPPCEGIALRNETYGGEQTPPLIEAGIFSNVIHDCSKGIVLGRSETAGELMQRVLIYRNTLADNGVNLFANAVDHRSFLVEENIFYNETGEQQMQTSGIRAGEYTFRHNGWGGASLLAGGGSSDSDVLHVQLDANYAPLQDYGIGAIDYVAPPEPPLEAVRLVLTAMIEPALAAELRKTLAGREYKVTLE